MVYWSWSRNGRRRREALLHLLHLLLGDVEDRGRTCVREAYGRYLPRSVSCKCCVLERDDLGQFLPVLLIREQDARAARGVLGENHVVSTPSVTSEDPHGAHRNERDVTRLCRRRSGDAQGEKQRQ